MLDVRSFFDSLSKGMVACVIALILISFWSGVLVSDVLFLTSAKVALKSCEKQQQQLTQELSVAKHNLAKCEENSRGNDCGKIVRQKEQAESQLKSTQARLSEAEKALSKSGVNRDEDRRLPPEARRLEIGSAFTGSIAKGQVLKFVFSGKANTPVIIAYRAVSDVYVKLTAYGPSGRRLVGAFTSDTKQYPFTPQKRGNCTLEVKGLEGYGKFGLQLKSL